MYLVIKQYDVTRKVDTNDKLIATILVVLTHSSQGEGTAGREKNWMARCTLWLTRIILLV